MAFEERIRVVIDVVSDRARTGLKSFRTDVTQAEGAMGKVQAGAKNLGTQFSQYLGPAALAAGSALVAFGVKSVNAFQETALAAGKFSDATGVAVEDASRWIEVAGDIGISAEQMEGSFAKLNRALGQGDLKQWGIDANNATDGFLQTVEALRRIEDPTQRALLAQQAFGRGYTQIAELTAMSAIELREALDGVSEAKTIDREEVRKAREMRAAMDDLNDKFEDVQLMIGEKLVPVVTDLAESLDALDTSFELPGLKESASFLDGFVNGITSLGNPTEAFRKTLEDLDPLAPRITGKLGDIAGAAEVLAGDIESGADGASDAILEVVDAIDVLRGRLDMENEMLDLQDDFDQVKQAAAEAFGAGVEGAADAESKTRAAQRATNDLKLGVIDYGQKVLELPDEKLTSILALIDQGSLDAAEQRLAILARNRTATVSIVSRGGAGYGGITGPFHSGGVVPGPPGSEQLALVKAGETILPTHQGGMTSTAATGSGVYVAPGGIVINGPADEQTIVNALERYNRRNGTSWFR